MKKISLILPLRSNVQALYNLLNSLKETVANENDIEVLCAVDDNDQVICDLKSRLEEIFESISLQFHITKQSDHFTKDYWNFIAKKASGRFIMSVGADCRILTKNWDAIIFDKMSAYAKQIGDDIFIGLTKDGLGWRRKGEDPLYPHFTCNPVLSKEQVDAVGYFYHEGFWTWGADHMIANIYRRLSEILSHRRLVSLTDVHVIAIDSIHTTEEKDEATLEIMRKLDKGYQKMMRVSQEHPYEMTPEAIDAEAQKLKTYIENKRGGK